MGNEKIEARLLDGSEGEGKKLLETVDKFGRILHENYSKKILLECIHDVETFSQKPSFIINAMVYALLTESANIIETSNPELSREDICKRLTLMIKSFKDA